MRNLLFFILIGLLSSCSDQKAELVSQIDEVTAAMKQEDFPSAENMDKIVSLYDEYIDTYPDDAESFTYMELKAKYLAANNKYDEAIKVYDDIVAKYTDDAKVADAIFMQAFIEENYKGNKEAAEQRYKAFLEQFPDHELADDARFSLENLSLTDEEIFQKLMQMQEGAVDSVVVE